MGTVNIDLTLPHKKSRVTAMDIHIGHEDWSQFLIQLDVIEDQLAAINHSILLLAQAQLGQSEAEKTKQLQALTEHLKASTEKLAAASSSVDATPPKQGE